MNTNSNIFEVCITFQYLYDFSSELLFNNIVMKEIYFIVKCKLLILAQTFSIALLSFSKAFLP